MAKPNESYRSVKVESYSPSNTSGLHGKIHIRPCEGQGFSKDLHVRCSKSLANNYPVGTQFLIKAKLTDREGGGEFLHSHHSWDYKVLD